jgi:hypothetical protein
MRHASADGSSGFSDRARAKILKRVKTLLPAFMQNCHQIDHMICALHCAINRPAEAQVCLNGLYLADTAKRLQMDGKVRAAHGNTYAVAAFGQGAHHMAAHKAGTTEDGDKFGVIRHSKLQTQMLVMISH